MIFLKDKYIELSVQVHAHNKKKHFIYVEGMYIDEGGIFHTSISLLVCYDY